MSNLDAVEAALPALVPIPAPYRWQLRLETAGHGWALNLAILDGQRALWRSSRVVYARRAYGWRTATDMAAYLGDLDNLQATVVDAAHTLVAELAAHQQLSVERARRDRFRS